MMNLDISMFVQAAFFLAIVGAVITLITGIRSIRSGRKLSFFRKRQVLIERGWRLIGTTFLLGLLAFFFRGFAEPLAYQVFPPSPTVTQTSTITATSTITLTSTISPTPTITPTISITPTPFIPTDVFVKFTSVVTPNLQAIFSKPQIAREINKDRLAVDPAVQFANPLGKLYGAFSYDKMTERAQWSALWVRLADQKVLCMETLPWNGGTGGYGYTECNPPAGDWQPGDYEVQIFVGVTWKTSTFFKVSGTPPTATITLTPTIPTVTPTPTRTVTPFPPTWTLIPTDTRWPSMTPTQ
jgi:hypothetical protein